MPIKEYQCEDCGTVSELLVGIGRNSSEEVCVSCGGAKLKPLMSAAAISIGHGGSMPADMGSCCGSNPSAAGCAGPGSCCGSVR